MLRYSNFSKYANTIQHFPRTSGARLVYRVSGRTGDASHLVDVAAREAGVQTLEPGKAIQDTGEALQEAGDGTLESQYQMLDAELGMDNTFNEVPDVLDQDGQGWYPSKMFLM